MVPQWLGANATKNMPAKGNHDFKWVDNGNLTYTNWNSQEPNNHGGNELCMDTINEYPSNAYLPGVEKLKWNDERCNSLFNFICVVKTA